MTFAWVGEDSSHHPMKIDLDQPVSEIVEVESVRAKFGNRMYSFALKIDSHYSGLLGDRS
jgi:hypothetical protein